MNGHPHLYAPGNRRTRSGMILLITLVILVILSALGYTLSVRVMARRHRDQYVIDYTIARHACVSAMRYAMESVENLEFSLVSRPEEPDFSDLFALSEPEYQKLLLQMEEYLISSGQMDPPADEDRTRRNAARRDRTRSRQTHDSNDVNDVEPNGARYVSQPNVEIRGPYGPPWPLVTEPIEFEIGSARVRIEIQDENAKYPLGWAVMADEKLQNQASASWATFCEWMGYTAQEIRELERDLTEIREIKPFQTEFRPTVMDVEPPTRPPPRVTRPTPGARTPAASAVRRTVRRTVSPEDQLEQQNKDFSSLFHSSMVDAPLLSRQSIASDSRKESAMKYLGLWATRQVNVNTAPRHVLEGALAFGSIVQAPRIAEAIIQTRRVQPITDVNDLKQAVLGYSDTIEGCRQFLTATSTVFTVRVTAVSGAATSTAVAAVIREGDKMQRIAVIRD